MIAQVHGICAAGASMLAICCDITLVAEDASIRWPALPLGGGLIGAEWDAIAHYRARRFVHAAFDPATPGGVRQMIFHKIGSVHDIPF